LVSVINSKSISGIRLGGVPDSKSNKIIDYANFALQVKKINALTPNVMFVFAFVTVKSFYGHPA
jgi:hypothetical protein